MNNLTTNRIIKTLGIVFRADVFISLLVFALVSTAYHKGGGIFATGDTIPNSLAALNLLKSKTFFFDSFRDSYLNSGHAFWFTETDRGNLVSSYPIGVSILTFPVYVVFYLFLSLFEPGFDITSQDFESYRVILEKISATLITSLSVAFFYLASRLKFSVKISLLVAFIYAFATSSWSTSSMALWQHGPANLVLIIGFYMLLLANRTSEEEKLLFRLFLAGVCFGFLPSVRPTSALFSIVFLAYSIYYYRWKTVSFLLGFASYLPALVWNLYNFGSLSGGYSALLGQASPYILSVNHLAKNALANLVSPSRGLLTASPVLFFSSLGLLKFVRCRSESDQDKWLVYTFCIGAFILFIQYSFYTVWTAGYSLGPRFMTDILLPLCYLLGYYLSGDSLVWLPPKKTVWQRGIRYFIFLPLLIFSTLVQVAFSNGYRAYAWNVYPISIDIYQDRAWRLKDNQIQRHFNALLISLSSEVPVSNQDLTGVEGKIRGIQINKYSEKVDSLLQENFGSVKGQTLIPQEVNFPTQELVYVQANIENTGYISWHGVASALINGEMWIRLRIYENENLIAEHRLSPLNSITQPGQNDVAIAVFNLPPESGEFQMVFDFALEGTEKFPGRENTPYVIDLTLK